MDEIEVYENGNMFDLDFWIHYSLFYCFFQLILIINDRMIDFFRIYIGYVKV